LQHGSLNFWNSPNPTQLIYPINAHIQGLWLFLMGHSEYLFFLVQWFSLIVITASSYEISRSLGFSSIQSLISALIGLSFPVVLLQIFSAQGDLTVTALVMTFIFFLMMFIQSKKILFLWISCLSIILAVGTKQTALFILPMAGLVILFLLITNKKLKLFLKSSWLLLLLFIVFSSFQFIQNLVNTGTPFGLESLLIEKYSSSTQVIQKALYVIPRFTYQFVGVDGLPRSIQPIIVQAKKSVFQSILDPLGLDLEKEVFIPPGFDDSEIFHYNTIPTLTEDNAWFGPFAFLLLPAAIVFAFFSKNKQRKKYALVCTINSLVYTFLIFIQRPGWDPYQGRYFILAVIPFVPLVSMLIPKQKWVRNVVIAILLPISMLLIINTLFYNDSKPIITARTQNDVINSFISPLPENNGFQKFVKKSLLKFTYPNEYSSKLVNIYEATYYDRLFYSNKSLSKDIEFINQHIPEGEPIAVMIPRGPLEYALFGKNRSRSLYPISKINDAGPGFILTINSLNIDPASKLKLLAMNKNYSIYYYGTQ
jgi:hypothetical protein